MSDVSDANVSMIAIRVGVTYCYVSSLQVLVYRSGLLSLMT